MNRRLRALCRELSLRFVDVWDTFFGRNWYYQRDGTHFSDLGAKVFVNHLSKRLFKPLKLGLSERPAVRRNPSPVRQVQVQVEQESALVEEDNNMQIQHVVELDSVNLHEQQITEEEVVGNLQDQEVPTCENVVVGVDGKGGKSGGNVRANGSVNEGHAEESSHKGTPKRDTNKRPHDSSIEESPEQRKRPPRKILRSRRISSSSESEGDSSSPQGNGGVPVGNSPQRA